MIVRMGWPRQSFAYRRTRSIVGSVVDCDGRLVFVVASSPWPASEDEPSGR